MKNILVGIIAGLLVGIVVLLLSLLPLFESFEYISVDTRFKFKGSKKLASIEDVVIVDIDNKSIDELGRWQDWPRSHYAKIIDYVLSGEVKTVAFDIFFPEYSRDKASDESLIVETRKGGNVVHSFFFEPISRKKKEDLSFIRKFTIPYKNEKFVDNKADRITLPIKGIQEAMACLGYDNKYEEEGVVRHYHLLSSYSGTFTIDGKNVYEKRLFFSLALATIIQALNVPIDQIKVIPEKFILLSDKKKIPIDKYGRMPIYYWGGRGVVRYVSFSTVFFEKIPKEYFENKIVLIGGSAEGLFDITANPYTSVYPGVEVHATAIYNILNDHYLTKIPDWLSIVLVFSVGVLIGLISAVSSLKRGSIIFSTILFGWLLLCVILFETKKIWLEMISPSFSITGSFLVVWLYRYSTEEREKKKIREMFSRYVSPDVVEVLVSNPDAFSLGGKRMELSVLFSDICGFTTISEKLSPEDTVSLLNEYFTAMNDVIFKYKGTLDKYIGDAIMVVFGAPITQEDHAKRAVLTGMEMIRELDRLREEWKARGKEEIDIGIGINTGEMVVGNIGSDIQTNYTVIGDEVNLASRLEGMTRVYDAQIIIGSPTYEKINDEIICREIDLIIVKGKTRPIVIYEPIGFRNKISEGKEMMLDVYNKGLLLYKERKFKEASTVFSSIMYDGIARMYFMRCQDYIVSPPPPDWGGIYVHKTK
ncbi:TPA: hypothetical protein DCX16_03785 [bacterium]|nr:hypothetical protein [bacterium]